ncbi:MAG: SpoIIE family protein phosphatase [Candidatus Hydrogenedentota bacterium]
MEEYNFKIETEALFESVLHIRTILDSVLKTRKVKDEINTNIKLAFTEAANNIIQHSYKGEKGYLGFELNIAQDGELKIILTDRGIPLDKKELLPRDIDEYSETGRGLKLIYALVDKVDFIREYDVNKFILQKRLISEDASFKHSFERADIEILDFFNVIRFIDNEEEMFSEFFERLENKIKADVFFISDNKKCVIHTHINKNLSMEQIGYLKSHVFNSEEINKNIFMLTKKSKYLLRYRYPSIGINDQISLTFNTGKIILLKLYVEEKSVTEHRINVEELDFFKKIGIEMKKGMVDFDLETKDKKLNFFEYEREYINKLIPFVETILKISNLQAEIVDYHYELTSKLDIFKELADAFHYFKNLEQVLVKILEIGQRIFNAEVGYIVADSETEKKSVIMGLDLSILSMLKTKNAKSLKNILEQSEIPIFLKKTNLLNPEFFNLNNLVCSNIYSRKNKVAEIVIGNSNEELLDNDLSRLSFEIYLYFTGTIIDNSLLYIESLNKEKIEKELEIAKEIQKQLLPHRFPEIQTIEMECLAEAAKNVGGDYFDIILGRGDKLGLIIADVSGKGVGPAIIMANLRGYFRGFFNTFKSVKNLVSHINNILCDEITDDRFVTMACVMTDIKTGELEIVVAGHLPVFLIRNNGDIEEFEATSLPVGILKDEKFVVQKSKINKNESIVLYTDGIIECYSLEKKEFGIDNFKKLLSCYRNDSPSNVIKKIKARLDEFSQGQSLHDDRTLLVITRR